MPFPSDTRWEKGEDSGQSGQKYLQCTLLSTPLLVLYFVWPNQTLVGGVCVNNLCQEGKLFALSVNRH